MFYLIQSNETFMKDRIITKDIIPGKGQQSETPKVVQATLTDKPKGRFGSRLITDKAIHDKTN